MTTLVVGAGIVVAALVVVLSARWRPDTSGGRRGLALAALCAAIVLTDALRLAGVAPHLVLVPAELGVLALLVLVASCFDAWMEFVCETWLIAGCLTLIGVVGALMVRDLPQDLDADCDVVLLSLALLVAVTIERMALVAVPRGPVRRALSLFVWGRFTGWLLVVATSNGLLDPPVLAVPALFTATGALATALLVLEVRHPTRVQAGVEPRLGDALPFALVGVVVVVEMVAYLVAPGLARGSVLILTGGCASALLCRQVLTNRRLARTVRSSQEQERYFRSLVQDSTDVIAICSGDGQLEYVSPTASAVLPGSDPAHLVGNDAADLVGCDEQTLREALAEAAATGRARVDSRRGEQALETSIARREGEYVLSVRDVTERVEMRSRLHSLSYLDALTGLPNRRRVLLDVADLVAQGADVHALFVDLDRFKHINDASGHRVGDAVLQQVAERLRAALLPGCLLGRLGGDEFVIVCDGQVAARELAGLVHRELARPFAVDDRVYQIGASIGIARHEPGLDADTLLQRADLAMYEAKLGHRPWAAFDPAMAERAQLQAAEDHVMAQEWGAGSVAVYLQPIVATSTLAVHSTEALLRWARPDGTVEGPAAALGFARRTGGLERLTGWIVEKVLAEVVATPGTTTPVAVNMPPAVLAEEAFVAGLAARIAGLGIPPTRITLEITEDAVVEQGAAGLRALRALHAEGFHLHIDDFGTGFSSLSYLLRLPVDGLKIDRSFTEEVATSTAARSVILGLVELSRELGIDLIAEGVETREQHEVLRRLGVPYAQGYWYARPQDMTTITDRSSLAGWTSGRVLAPGESAVAPGVTGAAAASRRA